MRRFSIKQHLSSTAHSRLLSSALSPSTTRLRNPTPGRPARPGIRRRPRHIRGSTQIKRRNMPHKSSRIRRRTKNWPARCRKLLWCTTELLTTGKCGELLILRGNRSRRRGKGCWLGGGRKGIDPRLWDAEVEGGDLSGGEGWRCCRGRDEGVH